MAYSIDFDRHTWQPGARILCTASESYPYAWEYEYSDQGWVCVAAFHGAQVGLGRSITNERMSEIIHDGSTSRWFALDVPMHDTTGPRRIR